MKALILAAGEGRRLRPVTDIPKPMVEVAGMPILEHNVRMMVEHGITDIAINLHYKPQVIVDHFGSGVQFGAHITYSYERTLQGTAGAITALADWLEGPFVVCYGDTYRRCNLSRLIALHQEWQPILTMAVCHQDDVSGSGIVELTGTDRVTRFLEKPTPDEVFSHWTNAGLMVCSRDVPWSIPKPPCDFSREVLPVLLQYGVRAYRMSGDEGVWPVDTPEQYAATMAAVS